MADDAPKDELDLLEGDDLLRKIARDLNYVRQAAWFVTGLSVLILIALVYLIANGLTVEVEGSGVFP